MTKHRFRKCRLSFLFAMALALVFAGCISTRATSPRVQALETVVVGWAEIGIALDGKLDDKAWSDASRQSLFPVGKDVGAGPSEAGSLMLCRDRKYLYVAFDFADRDVIQDADEDHVLHFRTGDVAEIFLYAELLSNGIPASHYWELFATPNGRKTMLFYLGAGRRGLPSNLVRDESVRVAANVLGTFRDGRDDDTGWTAEMAIPLSTFEAAGTPFIEELRWRVLVGRYNFGRHLPEIELSSYPQLTMPNFHSRPDFAPLHLEPRR